MSDIELRKKLIERISTTKNEELLQEAYRLLEMEFEDFGVYKLNDEQKAAVSEAKHQISRGNFLTDELANRDINEWLGK